jgi:AcrR family transcriptional regulator
VRAVAPPTSRGQSGDTGRVDPRARRTEQAILDATADLVREVGPAAVTIELVAERSEVARSTIYRRWSDIDELLLDVCAPITRFRPGPLTGDLRDDLRALARSYASELNDVVFREVLTFTMDAALRSRRYRSRLRAITRQRERRGVAIVRGAIGRGDLPDDIDPGAVVVAILAPLFQLRIAKHRALTDSDADAAVERAVGDAGDRSPSGSMSSTLEPVAGSTS